MDLILSRSAALGATKSEFAALVIQYWFDQGCPPVNAAESGARAPTPSGLVPGVET